MTPFLHVLALALLEKDMAPLRALVGRTLRAEGRTLDLGCGPGVFADLFATGDYVGVDPRASLVEYARRERPGAFLCEGLDRTELPDRRFEQALAFDVFGPRSDASARAVATELHRLLTPAGRALLIDREKESGRLERLASSIGRVERREILASGLRRRVVFVVERSA